MSLDEDLQKQFKAFRKTELQTTPGIVKEVNLANFSALVEADGILYPKVRLKANIDDKFGFVVVPKVNTEVLFGFIGDSINQSFVIKVNEVERILVKTEQMSLEILGDKIKLNGDNLGGIVKADELKNQVDKNTAILQALQNAISTWTPVPNDGGAAWKAAASSLVNMQRANLNNIKNNKVLHGE